MKPLAITLGDPAGIGPEVAARVLADASLRRNLPPLLLIGGRWALERSARAAKVRLPDIADVQTLSDAPPALGFMDLGGEPDDFCFGRVNADCGRLAVAAVEQAARLCMNGEVAAMVTCPIHKEAIHAAGYVNDIGHQEILARLTGAHGTATMLMAPGLKVVHLSTHKSLMEAGRYVTRETVLAKLLLMQESFAAWGLPEPRIAVAALNPHAGEGGLIGREEIEEIAPAVAVARDRGMNVSGPISADSVFLRAIAGEFDVVLALYHDQGHIAIKVHDFHRSTTATLGIPFIRTSVDHGTAFDIAGRGVADPRGLEAALIVARSLATADLASL